jgi:site-specific DNA-cytosine methylase
MAGLDDVEPTKHGWGTEGVALGDNGLLEWAVLDAQWFGVAQRRRRVFALLDTGDWASRPPILLEPHGVRGNTPPSRETRKEVTEIAGTLAANGGGLNRPAGNANELDFCGATVASGKPTIGTLMANAGTKLWLGNQEALSGDYHILQPTYGIPGNWIGRSPENGENAVEPMHDIAPCQTKTDVHAVAFHPTQDPISSTDGSTHAIGCGSSGWQASVAVACFKGGQGSAAGGIGYDEHVAPTLSAADSGSNRTPTLMQNMQVRRLTPTECSRLQGFPDDYLETHYANADEAHAAQILHELWKEARAPYVEKQEWRIGIIAALLSPQILLSGVYVGWLSWEMAERCFASRGSIQSENFNKERFLQQLRVNIKAGCSPHKRESFGQFAKQLNCSLQELPLEGTQARAFLRSSWLWEEAQRTWPLRYALATPSQIEKGSMNPDGPRYKALGNSMAVPVMRWIGERIDLANLFS